MSEALKVPSSMESETKGARRTELLEMISKAPPQLPETTLSEEEKEAEKSVTSPANQLAGVWEGTIKPHDSRLKSWTWSECHLRVTSLATPLPLSILRAGEEKSSQSETVANLRIKGSGLCKLDGEEKSERFMISGIMDSSSGYLELFFTLNKVELPATVVFLGRAQFDTLEIHATSSESKLALTRQTVKELPASSTSTTTSSIPPRGRRGRRNSETLTTSDLLGTRTPLIEALLYEAPVFTGPFAHFLKTPVAASGLMSGTTEGGDSHIAPLADISHLSGIWEGHCSTFALKETVALFDLNFLFKMENQLGVILGKGSVMSQNGNYSIIFRGSFSPFLQFGFVWAHLSATMHPVGESARSFQFLAKLDVTGKAIEAHDHNTAVYLSYQGPTVTPLTEQDFISVGPTVSGVEPASSPSTLSQPIPVPIPEGPPTLPYPPTMPAMPVPRRSSVPISTGDSSIDPLSASFAHLQMMGSSFPPQPQPMFHEPPSTFPPSLPLIDPSHPTAATGVPPTAPPPPPPPPQSFQTPPSQPPFHPAPPPTEKAPRTNPHHVLQTLRERPPSPMSIIPESTPDLPQAPHINKAFITKEGTLKSPLVNPEEDSNRQPRRLSAARAALTVSMYTMPRWLTLPLYLRCLVSTNSTHPYPYTHPSQLHPPTRRRKDSTTSISSTSDSRGSSRRGSTTSQGSAGRSEKNARRRRNRKSRPSSPQRPLIQSYPQHAFA